MKVQRKQSGFDCPPTGEAIRAKAVPDPKLEGMANLLIFPNIDSANIAFNLVKAVSDGLQVGPMLLGMGIAWEAHAGGYVAGALLMSILPMRGLSAPQS